MEDVNLNTDYAGEDDEANDTYTTVMIPAGGSVRYVIAGYLPENAGNDYQGQHYHGKLVLNAYQMDTTDGGDPDDIVINEVNKDLLQDLYDNLSVLLPLEGNFLPDTWQDFVNALDQAKDVLDNADATADEVTNAFEKLMDSSVNLVMEQSPDENLAYIIEKAESIVPAVDAGQYEEAGIEEFRAALAAAKEVQADPSASYSDIQEATYNLNEAMMNLRLKDNTNGITTFAANTADPMDVQVALFLTQYVAERDNLNAVDTAEAFFGPRFGADAALRNVSCKSRPPAYAGGLLASIWKSTYNRTQESKKRRNIPCLLSKWLKSFPNRWTSWLHWRSPSGPIILPPSSAQSRPPT